MYKCSICEPLNVEIIETEISQKEIFDLFERFPWSAYLEKMEIASEKDIQYSPSLQVENNLEKCTITFSAVGISTDFDFYIFFKRRKKRKSLFGLFSFTDKSYTSEIRGQSIKIASNYLSAFLRNDFESLNQEFQ
jgi:hypothetical protein